MPALTFDEILKFNQNHGPDGKFSSAPGTGGPSGVRLPDGFTVDHDDVKMFTGKSWDEFQRGDDLREYFRSKRNNEDHPLGKYADEKGHLDPDRVKEAWYYTNMSESAKGAHKITMDEADDIIGDNIKDSYLDGWFRAADSSYKPIIETATITNPELRNAALNVAYQNYADFQSINGGKVPDFDTWLTTPITVYRGEHGQKHVADDVYTAYSYDRRIAEKFGADVTEKKIRPIDTLGSYRLMGEVEIMVPSRDFGTTKKSARTFDEVLKFNPYHDAAGRFSDGGSATSFTIRTRDPSKQGMARNARENERKRVRTEAIHGVEDKIRNQSYESAALIDKDGNQIFFKDGGKTQVSFTREEVGSMQGATLTHNHPSGSMFSNEDIAIMVGGDLDGIRATTSSGKTFSLSRGDGYTDGSGVAFYNAYAAQRKSAIARANSELDAKGYQQKINSGEITQEAANRECNALVTTSMTEWASTHAKDYNMTFTVDQTDVA